MKGQTNKKNQTNNHREGRANSIAPSKHFPDKNLIYFNASKKQIKSPVTILVFS